jgi:hypothetical protein
MTGTNLQISLFNQFHSSFKTEVVRVHAREPASLAALEAIFKHYFGVTPNAEQLEVWQCRWRFVTEVLLRRIYETVSYPATDKVLLALFNNEGQTSLFEEAMDECIDRVRTQIKNANSSVGDRGVQLSVGHGKTVAYPFSHFLAEWYLQTRFACRRVQFNIDLQSWFSALECGLFFVRKASGGAEGFVLTSVEYAAFRALDTPEIIATCHMMLTEALKSANLDAGGIKGTAWEDYVAFTLLNNHGQAVIDHVAGPLSISTADDEAPENRRLPEKYDQYFDPTILFYEFKSRVIIRERSQSEKDVPLSSVEDYLSPNNNRPHPSWIRPHGTHSGPDLFTLMVKFPSFDAALRSYGASGLRKSQLNSAREHFEAAPKYRPVLIQCKNQDKVRSELDAIRTTQLIDRTGQLRNFAPTLDRIRAAMLVPGGHVSASEGPTTRSQTEADPPAIKPGFDKGKNKRIAALLSKNRILADWSIGIIAIPDLSSISSDQIYPPRLYGRNVFGVMCYDDFHPRVANATPTVAESSETGRHLNVPFVKRLSSLSSSYSNQDSDSPAGNKKRKREQDDDGAEPGTSTDPTESAAVADPLSSDPPHPKRMKAEGSDMGIVDMMEEESAPVEGDTMLE